MPRRLWLAGLLVLAAQLLAVSAPASNSLPAMIVPSRNIGPFHLGMGQRDVDILRRMAPCNVVASYTDGKATRLETNCGGAYRTAEHIQVGEGPARMLIVFGTPDQRTASDFAGVRGEWLHYRRAGIAFRLVYGDGPGNAIIQAIAVFKGTGPFQVRRGPVPVDPSGPTPGVGE